MTEAQAVAPKEELIAPKWYAFLRNSDDTLTSLGGPWVDMPEEFPEEHDVLVVRANEFPLEDSILKKGVFVVLNPHRSESPFKYTT